MQPDEGLASGARRVRINGERSASIARAKIAKQRFDAVDAGRLEPWDVRQRLEAPEVDLGGGLAERQVTQRALPETGSAGGFSVHQTDEASCGASSSSPLSTAGTHGRFRSSRARMLGVACRRATSGSACCASVPLVQVGQKAATESSVVVQASSRRTAAGQFDAHRDRLRQTAARGSGSPLRSTR